MNVGCVAQTTSPQPKLRQSKVFSAGNGENLYKFQVLTSQATCFSKARCTSKVVRVNRSMNRLQTFTS